MLLQRDPSLPHSWEQWLAGVVGQLGLPLFRVYADGNPDIPHFLALVKKQIWQPEVQELVKQHVEVCIKEHEAALWRLTLEHLHKIACARLPALLAPANGNDDDITPKAFLFKCSLPPGPKSDTPQIELQWDEEDLASRPCQWNLLELVRTGKSALRRATRTRFSGDHACSCQRVC